MANNVTVSFDPNNDAILESSSHTTNISFKGNGFAPYELFLGGFASCLHATFLGIAKKKRLSFDTVHYEVYATKREEVPTLLNYVKTTVTFSGVEDSKQAKIVKSLELAERYCSISALIGTVANMEFEYKFN